MQLANNTLRFDVCARELPRSAVDRNTLVEQERPWAASQPRRTACRPLKETQAARPRGRRPPKTERVAPCDQPRAASCPGLVGQPPAAQLPQRHSAHGSSPAQHGHAAQLQCSPHGPTATRTADPASGHFSPQRQGLHLQSGLHWHLAVGPATVLAAVCDGHFSPQRQGLHLHSGLHWHLAVGPADTAWTGQLPPAHVQERHGQIGLHDRTSAESALAPACTGQAA